MILIKTGIKQSSTPKNYSRKNCICSCLVPIVYDKVRFTEYLSIKYEVTPNKNIMPLFNLKKGEWTTHQHWGEFKGITEVPEILKKLNDEDFSIEIGYFDRDKIKMPCIFRINIINIQKYMNIKNKEIRKEKLNKINLKL